MSADTETLSLYEQGLISALDLFEQDRGGIKVLTIKVQCPKCGHTWGIKIDDYNSSLDIPSKKFVCSNCS